MQTSGPRTSSEQSSGTPDETIVLPKLNDGRATGNWKTHYDREARFFIYLELAYLLALLLGGVALLVTCSASYYPLETIPVLTWRPFGSDQEVLFWIATASSGLLGGTVMTLKWHYHCVAKKLWHADRRVWRITTPLLSAVVSLFVIMLLMSDIVSVISLQAVNTPTGGPAIAFILGLFSDNILAALQNFAVRTIGTLREAMPGGSQNNGG